MNRRTIVALLLIGSACTPAASTSDPGLPGVAATSSDGLRSQFVSLMLGAVREELTSWSAALRGETTRPLHAHYAANAAVAQPGGPLLKGDPDVRAFADSVTARANDGMASMLDFDVSDGIAYVYGAYHFQPARAGSPGSAGRHVTILRRIGGTWRIRTQLFQPGGSASPFPGVGEEADPPSIDVGTTESGTVPRQAFAEVLTRMAALRRAWADGDGATLARAFHRDGLLHLRDADLPARGGSIAATLREALAEFAALHTVELDFTASGRLAVFTGRYFLERHEGEGLDGHYVVVMNREGRGWRVRALVLS